MRQNPNGDWRAILKKKFEVESRKIVYCEKHDPFKNVYICIYISQWYINPF